jgi:ESS family glutamate:Na+ symporter
MGHVLTIKLNAIQVLALSCFGVSLGAWIKRRISWFDRFNIPAAIVGGLVFALLALVLRNRWANFEVDESLRNLLMVMFFTTIGMSASLTLLKKGGIQVFIFLLLASLGAILQNGVGIALAKLLGLSPLVGIVSGSVALTGGPGTALAFGATFEKMGVEGATALGVASAMFGITAGGLLGGSIGARFIRKFNLKPAKGTLPAQAAPEHPRDDAVEEPLSEDDSESSPLFNSIVMVAVAMGLGTLVTAFAERMGWVMPSYIGAMLFAAVLRNLDDWLGFARLSERHIETIGNVSLSIFIVMALLTLQLWQFVNLALPIFVLLGAQILLVTLLCQGVFYAMGKDYEAAVMSGGFCGFMLGTTANAMACMTVLSQKHGPAPRAFMVVPLVGAFLIDFTNAGLITLMTNWVK